MPTSRARHPIVETEQVARALDDAARHWPSEHGRSDLLLRLIEAGHRALRAGRAEVRASRLAAIEESHGAFPGMYGENYLEDLRRDWPA